MCVGGGGVVIDLCFIYEYIQYQFIRSWTHVI